MSPWCLRWGGGSGRSRGSLWGGGAPTAPGRGLRCVTDRRPHGRRRARAVLPRCARGLYLPSIPAPRPPRTSHRPRPPAPAVPELKAQFPPRPGPHPLRRQVAAPRRGGARRGSPPRGSGGPAAPWTSSSRGTARRARLQPQPPARRRTLVPRWRPCLRRGCPGPPGCPPGRPPGGRPRRSRGRRSPRRGEGGGRRAVQRVQPVLQRAQTLPQPGHRVPLRPPPTPAPSPPPLCRGRVPCSAWELFLRRLLQFFYTRGK